jgi:hypothetical protein
VARKKWRQPDQPEIPGMRRYLADLVAEGFILHQHDCIARQAAELAVEQAGLSETDFLLAWARGEFDG